jgi:SAM-dependent methyltransferase
MQEQLSQYFNLMGMNGASHLYRQANELGVLPALLKEPLTLEELAQQCGLQQEPLALLLYVLHSLRLIEIADERYRSSPIMAMLVGHYRNLSDEYWAAIPGFLRTGEPIKAMDDPAQSEQHYIQQAIGLAVMMQPSAALAAAHLALDGASILDIGAGAGTWSLPLLGAGAANHLSVCDWPGVLELLRQNAQKMQLDSRISWLPGSYHERLPTKTSFDVCLLGNVCHLETQGSLESLFKKVKASLVAGGRCVIFDVFPGQPEGDLQRSLYHLGLALRTRQGQVHAQSTLEELLRSAGFERFEFQPLRVTPHIMGMLSAW